MMPGTFNPPKNQQAHDRFAAFLTAYHAKRDEGGSDAEAREAGRTEQRAFDEEQHGDQAT